MQTAELKTARVFTLPVERLGYVTGCFDRISA